MMTKRWFAVEVLGLSRSALLVAAVAVLFTLLALQSWFDVAEMYRLRADGSSPAGPHEDYVAFYAAGHLVLDGRGDELYDVDAVAETEVEALGRQAGKDLLPYLNPPFLAAIFAPIAILPIEGAAVVIGCLTTLGAIAACYALQRNLRPASPLATASLWAGFLSLASVAYVVLHGQVSLLLLLGWALFVLFQMRGRERLSGVALALLLIKPHHALLPVAILLWRRQWKALAPFALIALALVAVSVAISGPAVLVEYPRFVWGATGWDGKWGVTQDRLLGWGGFVATIFEHGSVWHSIVSYGLWSLTLAAAALPFRGRWDAREPKFLLKCGGLAVASLLVNPHLYFQDLVLLALPLVLGLAYAKRTGGSLTPWVLLAAGAWMAQFAGKPLLRETGVNLLTPAMALVLAALLWPIARRLPVREIASRFRPRWPRLSAVQYVQFGYLAFIVFFAVVRRTWLMPDFLMILLFAGFVWGNHRWRFLRDFGPFVLLLFSYDVLRSFADDLAGGALVQYPIDADRFLFFGHVPSQELQRWFYDPASRSWYDNLASTMHVIHFVVPLIFAAYIWRWRNEHFSRFVTALLVLSYAAFVTYLLVPTAPPWLAAQAGHLDDVSLVSVSPHLSFLYNNLSPNKVAAMPSLHAAYPFLFLLFALRLWGRRALPFALYPLAVFLSIVYLGHHYVVDILAGIGYAGMSYWIVCGSLGRRIVRALAAIGSRFRTLLPSDPRRPAVRPLEGGLADSGAPLAAQDDGVSGISDAA